MHLPKIARGSNVEHDSEGREIADLALMENSIGLEFGRSVPDQYTRFRKKIKKPHTPATRPLRAEGPLVPSWIDPYIAILHLVN